MKMRYTEFRETVERELKAHPEGLTWVELRARGKFARAKACPEWTGQLERDIGLKRVKGAGAAKVWTV
jgi:hypothetical protein